MRTYFLISLPASNRVTPHCTPRSDYAGTRCARVGDNQYTGGTATVAGPLKTTKELARERGLAARTYRERAEIGRGLTEETLTSCRGPGSKITNNRVFANGYLKKDIREGRGGIVLVSAQGVEVANNILRGNRGDRQRTSRVSIHHNSLRNDTLRGCKLAGVVCRANGK
jgi:hypothetical protein